MTLSEKSAYLKGLMEGMNLDTETNEGKLLSAMVNLMADMAQAVGYVEDVTTSMSEELDEIEEDLDGLYEYISDEEDDFDDEDDLDDEDDFSEEDDYDLDDTTVYEVTCKCGEVIDFDEETLEHGSITCPICGEVLEFSTEDVEE
ncbi:MAG: CD1247 N-terminal domain-containing protein [Oscillospiraceae bacterium]|jgi:hypothetical protein